MDSSQFDVIVDPVTSVEDSITVTEGSMVTAQKKELLPTMPAKLGQRRWRIGRPHWWLETGGEMGGTGGLTGRGRGRAL